MPSYLRRGRRGCAPELPITREFFRLPCTVTAHQVLRAVQGRVRERPDRGAACSSGHRGDENRLDGVHAVLGLIEHDGCPGLEYVVGHFHRVNAEGVEDVLADLRLAIMEGR